MNETLELSIDIAARPQTVYAFLTDATLFTMWMGTTSQLSEGSDRRSFTVPYPDGSEAAGELLEAVPSSRVVYSWGYRDGRHGLAPGASTVVIELVEIASGTRLTLRHEGLPSETVRHAHSQGWRYYVGLLAARAAERHTTMALEEALDAWLTAWNTADSTAVARACEDDVEYADRLTRLQGRDALVNYIAQARAFAPAARLALDGRPSVTHAFARFDWQMRTGETPIGNGTAFAELSLNGKLVRVVSFWS